MECSKCKVNKSKKDFFKKTAGKTHSYCKQCLLDYQNERWRLRKQKAIEYKGGKCIKCGYSNPTCLRAMAFHHRDPSKKELHGNQIKSMSWSKVVKELDKCDLVCVRCHAEIHGEEDWYSRRESNPELRFRKST